MTELYTTHADLYDAAFNWDVSNQVTAIAGLSGLDLGRVLEPMCGSGRLLRGFAAAGFTTVGIDQSAPMLALGRAHYARSGFTGEWLEADVSDFDLDEGCDLAVCPVNSLAHLATEALMQSHLNAVSRNLYTGRSYWIQLDLKQPEHIGEVEEWEFEYQGATLLSEWASTGAHNGMETHISRIVFPDGRVVEESYDMKLWSYEQFTRVLAATPFELSGAYTGSDFKPLAIDSSLDGQRIFWQQLVKQD